MIDPTRHASSTGSAQFARGRGQTARRRMARKAMFDRLEDRTVLSVTPLGTETLVNTTVSGDQGELGSVSGEGQVNSVAADANGNYVVVWQGNGAGDSSGVFARRFLADGTPQGSEFLINTTTAGGQGAPVVAMADNGLFAVAWATPNPGTTSNRPGVIARIFNADGSARTGEIQVTAFSKNDGNFPTGIAMDAVGNFVVAIRGWTGDFGSFPGHYNSGLVKFQRVSAAGQLQGKLTQVFDSSISNNSAEVAMDASGNFVMVWSDFSMQAQRYDSAGRKLGGVILTGLGGNPSIARADGGAFVIAGARAAGTNGPSDPGAGVAQFYDTNGVPQGNAFDFASTALVKRASVALDPLGNALFSWGVNAEISASRFTSSGTPLEGEFGVNTTTAGPQGDPTITPTSSGEFVVVWDGNGAGDDSGVFAQRFTTASTSPAGSAGATSLPPVRDSIAGLVAIPTADLASDLLTTRSRRAGGQPVLFG